MWGKIVSWVLCVAVVLATSVPLTASAQATAQRDAALSPQEVIDKIDAMGLADMPDEVAAELRGEGLLYILAGYALQIASWCTMYCQQAYDMADAYLNLVSSYYRSLPRGTPVYAGTAQSTPAYYKK